MGDRIGRGIGAAVADRGAAGLRCRETENRRLQLDFINVDTNLGDYRLGFLQ